MGKFICLIRKRHDLFIAVALNVAILLLDLVFCDIKYEVSDDFIMESIMSGAFGNEANPQLIFMNTILGYFMLPFYKIIPGISWYFVFQILVCLFSFILVTYMLLKKYIKPFAIILSLLFILFFSDDVYILPQFTKASMVAMMSGAIVFLWTIFQKRSLKLQIISGIMCLIGSMIRIDSIYLSGGFLLWMIIWEIFRAIRNKKDWKKESYIPLYLEES